MEIVSIGLGSTAQTIMISVGIVVGCLGISYGGPALSSKSNTTSSNRGRGVYNQKNSSNLPDAQERNEIQQDYMKNQMKANQEFAQTGDINAYNQASQNNAMEAYANMTGQGDLHSGLQAGNDWAEAIQNQDWDGANQSMMDTMNAYQNMSPEQQKQFEPYMWFVICITFISILIPFVLMILDW